MKNRKEKTNNYTNPDKIVSDKGSVVTPFNNAGYLKLKFKNTEFGIKKRVYEIVKTGLNVVDGDKKRSLPMGSVVELVL